MDYFPRPALAHGLALEITGQDAFSDASNGLFLTAPRRTGKTEFLRHDLAPALEATGALVLYVDLFEDRSRPPMQMIAAQLAKAALDHLGVVASTVKKAGIDKIGLPGMFGLDLTKLGQSDGASLFQALNGLHKAAKKPIALIIDEAQHALTSEDGESTMWALKSARDQMKLKNKANLMLVMSGSHVDKLNLLLNAPNAPFWGSETRQLPYLGDDYVEALARALRFDKPELSGVRTSQLVAAFKHFGYRPQLFMNALRRAKTESHDGASLEQAILRQGQAQNEADRARFTAGFLALTPTEQAVMSRLITSNKNFRAFDADALKYYAQFLGKDKVTVPAVQRALDSLRNRDDEWVWKSLRGDYSVYDQAIFEWQAHLEARRAWPPRG